MNFTLHRSIKAPPDKVWKLISDFSFSPGNGVDVRVIDAGAENGKNLIRDIKIGFMTIREKIIEIEPGKSFSYSIIQGTPTKSYIGKCLIEKKRDETIIIWSGDFVPKFPLIGIIVKMVAKKTVTKFLDAVLSEV
jgi:uncharacterized protein YndB with AHSA1/START domain